MNFRLLLLSLLLPTFLYAQSNYKSGYVINTQGDTLKGYINYREWEQSPKYIEFKQTQTGGQPTRFAPNMLQGFVVTGMDGYATYTGPVTMDKNVFPDLPNGLDTTVVQDTVFLQVIYRGKPLSLFSYKDKIKHRLFIQEAGGQPYEIKYYQYYTDNSQKQVREYNPYAGNLNQLAAKYNPSKSNIWVSIERGKFTEADVLKIVKQINNDQTVTHTANGGSRFIAGVTFNCINILIDGNNRFAGQRTANYIPSINIGFDLFLNKYTQRLIFRNELNFSTSSGEFNAVELEKIFYNYKLSQHTFSWRPQIIYNVYNKEHLQFYLGAGISINYSVYGKNQYTNTIYSSTFVSDKYYALSSLWANFPLQAGAIINKKFDLYALYMPPTAFSSQVSFSIGQSVYGIGTHYYFK